MMTMMKMSHNQRMEMMEDKATQESLNDFD